LQRDLSFRRKRNTFEPTGRRDQQSAGSHVRSPTPALLLADSRQQRLPFGRRQPQVGDITGTILGPGMEVPAGGWDRQPVDVRDDRDQLRIKPA
jgi:hypothetical protein